MDYELLFPSEFLKAADLRGREATLKIEAIDIRELQLRGTGQTKRRGVITFDRRRADGTASKLVLNRTNAEVIAAAYGKDTDAWIGKSLTLFSAQVQFGRDTVDAIRVRVPNGKAAAKDAAE